MAGDRVICNKKRAQIAFHGSYHILHLPGGANTDKSAGDRPEDTIAPGFKSNIDAVSHA
jgi:hypothetical protein